LKGARVARYIANTMSHVGQGSGKKKRGGVTPQVHISVQNKHGGGGGNRVDLAADEL